MDVNQELKYSNCGLKKNVNHELKLCPGYGGVRSGV